MTESIITMKPIPSGRFVKGRLKKIYSYVVWLPPLFVVLAAISAWNFVKFAFISNPALNGLILFVMLWGAITMALHVRSCYKEDRIFFAGMDWLKNGPWGGEPDPKLGPDAFVLGMLERLEKIGLGHQVYVHNAAMEPEIEALEHYFEQKQQLSNFLVGLMVGLGLLGTFVGLLETLISTSELIGHIAASLSGGGDMEAEFAKIVSGLQKPLSSMGTAFSASMFGLMGSIMLGFQTVVVNKTISAMVEDVREEVLSLAEKSKVNSNVAITERYLATLLADMMEQHRQTEASLLSVSEKMSALTGPVEIAAVTSAKLVDVVGNQTEAMERNISAVSHVQVALPLISELASATAKSLQESISTGQYVAEIAKSIPDQLKLKSDLQLALEAMNNLRQQVSDSHKSTQELSNEVRLQGAVLKRLEGVLWNAEKNSLRKTFDEDGV